MRFFARIPRARACSRGGATPWSFSIIIAKVHYASTVNGISNYNFDWKSDATTAGGPMTAPP